MKTILLKLSILLLIPFIGYSQDGVLDSTFANNAVFLHDSIKGSQTGNAIQTTEDGKIYISYSTINDTSNRRDINWGILRLNEDGTYDNSFNEDGVFNYINSDGTDFIYDIEIDDQNRTIGAGSYGINANASYFSALRLTEDGQLDQSFGDTGMVKIFIDSSLAYCKDIMMLDDGGFVLAGYSINPDRGNTRRNIVARLDQNGQLDTDFGDNGVLMFKNDSTDNKLEAVIMHTDGDFLVSGYNEDGDHRMVVYKVKSDGSAMDSTWGVDGAIYPPAAGEPGGSAYDIVAHPDGFFYVLGGGERGGGIDLFIGAFNYDGTTKTDFGINGVNFLNVAFLDLGIASVVQPDGKILVTGEGSNGIRGNKGFLTARYNADGSVDSTWGGEGFTFTNPGNSFIAFANGVALQKTDYKVLVVGATSVPGSVNDVTVFRYGNVIDGDGDGVPFQDDCDDNNKNVYQTMALFIDNDGDMYDDGLDTLCIGDTIPDGYITETLGEDCDDENPNINPGAEDIPNNDIDEDCDGEDSTTAVSDNVISQNLILYPNPATSSLTLDLTNLSDQNVKIQLVDILGAILVEKTVNTQEVLLDVSKYDAGTYFIRVFTSDDVGTISFIKK